LSIIEYGGISIDINDEGYLTHTMTGTKELLAGLPSLKEWTS
jgi:hypothetical protein